MDFPQPVLPTIARYSPFLIDKLRSSRITGPSSEYLKVTFEISMSPEIEVGIFLHSLLSGFSFITGLIRKRIGHNFAKSSVTSLSEISAELIKPKAELKAM